MTNHKMSGLDFLLLGLHGLAFFCAVFAACVELAAGGRIGRGRNGAFQDNPLHARIGIRDRDCGEERLCVGVERVLENIFLGAVLHQVAEVHDAYGIGNVLNNGQVVRNEEITQISLLLQFLEQVDDLRLDGNVQGGYRLVADDEFRVQGKCTRDTDSLPLAAGELVRVTGLVEGLQAAVIHDFVHVIVIFRAGYQAVLADRFSDDLTDGKSG